MKLRIKDTTKEKALDLRNKRVLMAHEKQLLVGEFEFKKRLKPLLDEQKREVEARVGFFKDERGIIKAVHKAIDPFDMRKWVTALIRFERPLVTADIIAGAVAGFNEANDNITAFNLQDPTVTDGIKRQTENFATKFNASTERELQRNIRQSIDLKETPAELQARINKVYMHAKTFRADRAARTETGAAINLGKQVSYMQSSVVAFKRWLTARDGAVRDHHANVDGDEVRRNRAFTVDGEKLMYPRDPRGSAGNIINCRCTTVAVIQ